MPKYKGEKQNCLWELRINRKYANGYALEKNIVWWLLWELPAKNLRKEIGGIMDYIDKVVSGVNKMEFEQFVKMETLWLLLLGQLFPE